MHKKIAGIACAAVALTGCTTSISMLKSDLPKLLGQDIKVAVTRIGYPDGQREMLGDTLYIWSTDHEGLVPAVNTAATFGSLAGLHFSGVATSVGVARARYYCAIQLATNKDGSITHWQFQGNQGGCNVYAYALNRH